MKRSLSILLLIAFCCVFLVSGYFLVEYIYQSIHSANQFVDLENLHNRPSITPSGTGSNIGNDPTDPDATGSTDSTEATEPPFVDQLITIEDPITKEDRVIWQSMAELYRLNTDIVGYISAPGVLQMDYPVMQHPDSKDYYLQKDFYKAYSTHGCLYVKEDCDVVTPSDNLTIYGHNMKDGSMFAGLLQYQYEDFYKAHPTFTFETLTEKYEYQIIAVFKTSGYTSEGGYPYHKFVNASSEAEFNEFISAIKDSSRQFYDTGVTAQYGDKLITLSTCEYTLNNGRFVVVAKRIVPPEATDPAQGE